MSVINKMLKDLDNRQQPHKVQNISTLQQNAQGTGNSKLPWVIVVLLVFIGIGFYLYQSLAAETQIVDQPFVAKAVTKKTAIIESVPPVKPTEFKLAHNEQPVVDNEASKAPQVQAQQTAPISKDIQAEKVVAVVNDTPPKVETKQAAPKPEPKPEPEQSVLEIKEVKLSAAELATKLSKQAQDAELSGNLTLARDNYAKALTLDAAKHDVRKKLAALYYGERNNRAATQLLNDGIQRFPKQSEFKLLLAKIQIKENKPQQAYTTLNSIADTDAIAPEKWIQQGSIAQQQKQYLQAVAAFKKLTVYEPSTARWWLGLGYNLDAAGEYVPAAEAYRKALQLSNLSSASRNYIVSRLAQITANK